MGTHLVSLNTTTLVTKEGGCLVNSQFSMCANVFFALSNFVFRSVEKSSYGPVLGTKGGVFGEFLSALNSGFTENDILHQNVFHD